MEIINDEWLSIGDQLFKMDNIAIIEFFTNLNEINKGVKVYLVDGNVVTYSNLTTTKLMDLFPDATSTGWLLFKDSEGIGFRYIRRNNILYVEEKGGVLNFYIKGQKKLSAKKRSDTTLDVYLKTLTEKKEEKEADESIEKKTAKPAKSSKGKGSKKR